jgi:hypothetical protein
MDEWLPLPRIARVCDLPESSARRYALALADFIPQRRAGRLVLYQVEIASQVLTRASEMFGKGMRLAQVREAMAAEMPEPQDVTLAGDRHMDASPPAKPEVMAVEFMRSVNAIREDLATMGTTLERVQGELRDERMARQRLADENEGLRQKMGILETELVRLRKDRRELEKYLLDKIDVLRNR